jgi:hypothetical protein
MLPDQRQVGFIEGVIANQVILALRQLKKAGSLNGDAA